MSNVQLFLTASSVVRLTLKSVQFVMMVTIQKVENVQHARQGVQLVSVIEYVRAVLMDTTYLPLLLKVDAELVNHHVLPV